MTGQRPVLEATGETFDERQRVLAAASGEEVADVA
jgi:hypothetical protein